MHTMDKHINNHGQDLFYINNDAHMLVANGHTVDDDVDGNFTTGIYPRD